MCVVISSYLNFLNADEKKFTHGGTIKARVLPPFQTKGMTAESGIGNVYFVFVSKQYLKLNN